MIMDVLVNQLLELLEAETSHYQSLLSFLAREKKAIMAAELPGLNAAGREKEKLVSQLRALDGRRREILEKIACHLGASPQGLTLKRLSVEVQNPLARRLTDCAGKLAGLIQNIRKVLFVNHDLLRHSQKLVCSSLALFSNLIQPTTVYHPSGRVQSRRGGGRILSGSI